MPGLQVVGVLLHGGNRLVGQQFSLVFILDLKKRRGAFWPSTRWPLRSLFKAEPQVPKISVREPRRLWQTSGLRRTVWPMVSNIE